MLLKKKSKIGISHKSRKKYDALMPEKRLKANEPPVKQGFFVPKPQMEEQKKPVGGKVIQPKIIEHYDSDMKH